MSIDVPDWGYYSHMPVLGAALAITNKRYPGGTILELGCGHGSTHLIHLASDGRMVYTADTNGAWLQNMATRYKNTRHRFELVQAQVPLGSSGVNEHIEAWISYVRCVPVDSFSLIFVDCWPGEARMPLIRELLPRTKIIVAHDTEADEPPGGGNYGWREIDGLTHHRFEMLRPWTTAYFASMGDWF